MSHAQHDQSVPTDRKSQPPRTLAEWEALMRSRTDARDARAELDHDLNELTALTQSRNPNAQSAQTKPPPIRKQTRSDTLPAAQAMHTQRIASEHTQEPGQNTRNRAGQASDDFAGIIGQKVVRARSARPTLQGLGSGRLPAHQQADAPDARPTVPWLRRQALTPVEMLLMAVVLAVLLCVLVALYMITMRMRACSCL